MIEITNINKCYGASRALTPPAAKVRHSKNRDKDMRITLVLLVGVAFCSSVYAQSYSAGTGFFVSTDGYLATNHHVIQSAKSIIIRTTDGRRYSARRIRVDADNDIAILKVEGTFNVLPIDTSRNVRRGDRVFTLGFPNIGVQGVEVKYTEGVISSLTGLSDTPNHFQITVPLQPGNSGGPLISRKGNVIGLVTSKLSATAMIRRGGSLPENVNYAVKSNYLLELLSTLGAVKPENQISARKSEGQTMSHLASQAETAIAIVVANNEGGEEIGRTTVGPSLPQPAPGPSQLSAANLYQMGQRAWNDKREREAMQWFRRSAELGYSLAQAALAIGYQDGHGGLPKDDVQAVMWFRKAAEQGHAFAQSALGVMYVTGRGGLPKDEDKALALFRKSAEKTEPTGQYNLGLMYANGLGGLLKDDAQAAAWYRKAAEQGNAKAQSNLGFMYETGRGGLPKDEVQAVEWYRRAAAQGNEIARRNLNRLGKAS